MSNEKSTFALGSELFLESRQEYGVTIERVKGEFETFRTNNLELAQQAFKEISDSIKSILKRLSDSEKNTLLSSSDEGKVQGR